MEIIKEPTPPRGLQRLMWRLPIHVFRLNLGWLFGGRLMLLTHTGRVTGRPRQAVIEVVERSGDGYVAASGFGPRSDWYQNVVKTPEVTVRVGGGPIPATAVPLGTDEGAEIMARYAPRHPVAARHVCKIMGFAVDGSVDDYRAAGRHIPFVRFMRR